MVQLIFLTPAYRAAHKTTEHAWPKASTFETKFVVKACEQNRIHGLSARHRQNGIQYESAEFREDREIDMVTTEFAPFPKDRPEPHCSGRSFQRIDRHRFQRRSPTLTYCSTDSIIF